ncbi:interleukin-6 receptor subunit beta-like [Mercenaria mercenaria]|uniref:interleukin-6 receptor subunit beta-like n=1 Tax=Mercenaria mercenaria TaxID=6596 RepID=UPI00234F1378|nr:interleukin-6 receptor subunit beta-like [Mercenaria mercenaria]
MAYQSWFFITAVIYMYLQHGHADDINDDLTCVIKYDNWVSPASVTVNWTIPPLTVDPEDLKINITWYTLQNTGPCPEIRLTSCTWYYGYAMNFYFNFNVSVIITTKTAQERIFNKDWDVDPDACRKPPGIDHMVTESINSTCVNVSWWYNKTSKCSSFDGKFYQISYGRKIQTEFKTHDPENSTLVTVCNTSRIICNLQPFTMYVFDIQAKFGDWKGQISGHFSDSKLTTLTTLEDVPAGAPDMARGGFSVIENKCTNENIRTIRIYWKDVPSHLKHGIITHFLMDIRELPESGKPVTKSIHGQSYNYLVTLKCNTKYEIRLQAETSVGISSVYSSLSIPDTTRDSERAIKHVIPVIANESFHVYWLNDIEGDTQSSVEHRVFWCLKNVGNHCMSPINWTKVSNNSSFVSVPVQHWSLSHNYRFGVGYGDTGITWENCHYTQTEDLRPPVGLRLESNAVSPDGSMSFYWDNYPCESHPPSPFTNQFVISFCTVKGKNDKTCLGTPSKTIVDGRRNAYVFTDMDPDEVYMICLQAVGISSKHFGNSSCTTGQPAAQRKNLFSNYHFC